MSLLRTTFALSLLMTATAHASNVQFLVGVDNNKGFAGGIEALFYDNFIIGGQANLGSTDETQTQGGSLPDVPNATFTQKKSSQAYSLYTGYRFKENMLDGLTVKLGISKTSINLSEDAYNSSNESAVVYDINESKYQPFVGLGYHISERISLNVHANLAGIDTIEVEGETVKSGFERTTLSFLVGFTF
ncbi:outer membrane beta-barrel protein [Vibrio maritimus]|uniref:outer membrane beta-barrel protein n=1 Tax=Vibrio maritimus TaxID=990268 RepID=UPI001F32DEF1|nr:outer membrane beta-barrel protein [Vibrio maritimus]